jgi:hypothetical protein
MLSICMLLVLSALGAAVQSRAAQPNFFVLASNLGPELTHNTEAEWHAAASKNLSSWRNSLLTKTMLVRVCECARCM